MRNTLGGVCFGTAIVVTGWSTSALADDNNARLEGIVTGTYQAESARFDRISSKNRKDR